MTNSRDVAGIAPFPLMGIPHVSAVGDEGLGIEHAVTNIVNWAEDREGFPDRRVDAGAFTMDRARSGSSYER